MAQRNRQNPVVPQAEPGLEQLKFEITQQLGIPQQAGVTAPLDAASYEKMLDKYKDEVASDLNLLNDIRQRGWPNMPSRLCGRVGGRMGGKIGGQMVKRMIQMAEQSLAGR